MQTVYEASNAVEAHMLQGYLQQEGIATRVEGAYLQGAVGELAAQGFVRLVADEGDVERARAAIARWESSEAAEAAAPTSGCAQAPAKSWMSVLLGVAIGVTGAFAYFRTPVTDSGVDYNRDGVLDERWVYAPSGSTLKSTIDRNLDTRIDYITHFDHQGEADTAEADDDFDGVFETRYLFKNGSVVSAEADTDGDAYPDLKANYTHGVLDSAEYIDPASGWPVRVEHYRLGKITAAEVDANRDGKLDTRHLYSGTADITRTETIAQP
ncbi:MAG TPA: DUF2007 domain-containing protein [Thiobacillus sp.]|nr:MAG: hypothetical protein B7Y50_09330 [Hydrogenophilales bacterium 28-61-11]OYZ56464.1 MAG: hypothetical protein B7Y21_11495 [Hydrogenophilales bacterium 16-61-112]OZA45314.1 MAG: hypothetical protein B7X81_08550 [Hydrogenophilales bacterium 17-61-76]HQT30543.1 DUF2007 domain-containing protein [Thiobacillus sp.]HQT70854.1 DUF2007 domain-containing protein [Thiobacillus sp.]